MKAESKHQGESCQKDCFIALFGVPSKERLLMFAGRFPLENTFTAPLEVIVILLFKLSGYK
jgi:hypothetical protein